MTIVRMTVGTKVLKKLGSYVIHARDTHKQGLEWAIIDFRDEDLNGKAACNQATEYSRHNDCKWYLQ